MLEDVLLSAHVLAAIVFIGGSAVAASLFPRYAPIAATAAGGPAPSSAAPSSAAPSGPATPQASERSTAVAAALHRITRGYALIALVVPVAGIALAGVQGRMGEIWITLAMILTAVAAILLAAQIVPRQRAALTTPGDAAPLRTLSMLAGLYNLTWAVVVVLMIVRPGAEH